MEGGKEKKLMPWVEKYRPKTVDEVSYQDEVVSALKKSIQTANLPHLLFYGPPGTGKTSTILALAKQLYGPELYRDRVMELNASDDRGIDVVRTKIKNFAQISVGTHTTPGYPCPPYKIVILDEADSMTDAAQAALRRTMETYSAITRFCIICNYISKIIDPLTSRCAKFRFKALQPAAMKARLADICEMEKVTIDEESLDAVIETSGGDMRRAVTMLQCASALVDNKITVEAVHEVGGVVPPAMVVQLVQACRSKKFEEMRSCTQNLFRCGYSAGPIISQLFEHIVNDGAIPDMQKSKIVLKFSAVDKCLGDGADEQLQLLDLLSFCSLHMK